MAETLTDGQGGDLGSSENKDLNAAAADTEGPTTNESSEQETIAKELPQVTPANVEENGSSDVTSDKPGISVPEESATNEKSNTIDDQPAVESVPQESTAIIESALECKENSEIQNIECDSKDMLREDFNKTFDSDCEIIADPVNMVDLTDDDSMIQEASHSNIEDDPKNSVDLTESSVEQETPLSQVEPEKAKEKETTNDQPVELSPNDTASSINSDQTKKDGIIISAADSEQNETPTVQSDHEVAPEKVDQNIEEDVSMEKSNATETSYNQQYNLEAEPETLNSERSNEDENIKDQQAELSQNNSEQDIHTADQDKSREDQSNLEVPELAHQNIEDVPMEESSANKSTNNQPNNSEVEPEKSNEEEPKENASSKDQMSVENTVVNETNTNESDATDVVSEMVNPNTVVDISMEDSEMVNENEVVDLSMEEYKENEPSNNQETATINSEPKTELNTSTNNIPVPEKATKPNDTVTFKKILPKQCYRCGQTGHLANACPKLKQNKAVAKRVAEEVLEIPAAKKHKSWPQLPLDLPAFICQNQENPKVNRFLKLKMIKECQVLYLNPIPKTWKHNAMNNFMVQNTRCVTENERHCFYIFVRDDDSNYTGECLVKFRSTVFCQTAWFDLRGVKIDNTPVTVDLDLGHEALRQVRKENKYKVKQLLDPDNEDKVKEEPKKNVYKFIEKKHDEMMQQKMQTGSNVASSEANTSAASNNNKTDVTGPSSGPQNSQGPSNGPQNNVPEKRAYMPKEQFGNTTYGLNEGFLTSLGLKLPLSNVLIVIGVDVTLNDDKIKEIFSLAGVVKRHLRVLKKDGSPTWRVMIEYDHPVEAVQAISMFQGKLLYGSDLRLKMVPPFPRPLPLGLTEIGPGLGHEGEPMRGVRSLIELQALKKMLTDFKGLFDSKIKEIEKAIAEIPKAPIVCEPEVPKKAPTPVSKTQPTQSQATQSKPAQSQPAQSQPTQSQATDTATQLVNALSSLAQPNFLMGLSTLLSAQGLVQPGLVQPGVIQPGMGTDPAMALQSQMVMQNAAYQNFNMPQGMPQQPLPGYPQPEMVQPPMIPPMDQTQMVAQPYFQNQMVQPGFVPIQPVPPPAPVPPAKPPQPTPPPPPTYQKQTPSAPKPAPQQTPAYTPRVPKPAGQNQNPGPSKGQLSNSNWRQVAPVATKKQKTVEPPKPAFLSEPTRYTRPSRFDMKEKPNLKVIEPVPEPPQQKNDMLVFTNLPSSVTVNALNSKMREVGDVMFSEITGRGRALVRFKFPRDAERCIKLFNRSKVDGQVINVEFF